MNRFSFPRIAKRFSLSLAWCALIGAICGLSYRFGSPKLRETILAALNEHGAPITYNAVGTIALITLGVSVALFGRTKLPASSVRLFACYQPAELALSVAAVFFGLWLGFATGLLPEAEAQKVLAVWVVGFAATVGILIFLLWASFEGHGKWSEATARWVAAVSAAVGAGVFWSAYVR